LGGILPAVSTTGQCETYTPPCSIVFPASGTACNFVALFTTPQ